MRSRLGLIQGAQGYLQPGATSYDGIVDRFTRSAFTNAPAAAIGVVHSCWVRLPTVTLGSGNFAVIYSSEVHVDAAPPTSYAHPIARFEVYDDFAASGKVRVYMNVANSIGENVYFDCGDGTPDFGDGQFHHLLYGADFTTGQGQIYADDVQMTDTDAYSSSVGFPFDYDSTAVPEWNIASTHGVIDSPPLDFRYGFVNGCLCERWLDFLAPPDFSISSNRRKFITAASRPSALGSHGELPFGTRPIDYDPEGNGQNRGYGGSYIQFGAPGACGSRP